MKVLGVTSVGSYSTNTYIVEITESELKSAFEKGYDSTDFSKLKTGDVISLASMPDQRQRITKAIDAMNTAYEAFVKAAPVMAEVARVIASVNQSPLESP